MSKTRRSWSDTELKKSVSTNKSIAGVIRSLNLIPAGGNYTTIKNRIKELNLNTSHFTGKGWNLGLKFKPKSPKPLEDILVKDSNYQSYKLLKRLKKAGLKGNACERCGLTTWKGKRLSLELHHINGDKRDNRIENLQVLCPNCHSITDNYRGRNKSASQETGKVESP